MIFIVVLIIHIITASLPSNADVIKIKVGKKVGKKVEILDGNTIVWNGERIRLRGVEAPDIDQNCLDSSGKKIECGKIAKQKLEEIIGNNQLECEIFYNVRFIGNLVRCYAGGIDVNRAMISRGYAMANTWYDWHGQEFVDEEKKAKKKKVGFWDGEFQKPEQWSREDYRKQMGGIEKVDFLCEGNFENLENYGNKSKAEISKIKDECAKYQKILEHHIIQKGYMKFNEETCKEDIPLDMNEVSFAIYDINGDGEKEILFYIFENGYCGSAGCAFEILKKDNEGKWNELDMPVVGLGAINVSEGVTKLGYKDFVFPDGWKGDDLTVYNVWRWNGKEYDYYKKLFNLTESL